MAVSRDRATLHVSLSDDEYQQVIECWLIERAGIRSKKAQEYARLLVSLNLHTVERIRWAVAENPEILTENHFDKFDSRSIVKGLDEYARSPTAGPVAVAYAVTGTTPSPAIAVSARYIGIDDDDTVQAVAVDNPSKRDVRLSQVLSNAVDFGNEDPIPAIQSLKEELQVCTASLNGVFQIEGEFERLKSTESVLLLSHNLLKTFIDVIRESKERATLVGQEGVCKSFSDFLSMFCFLFPNSAISDSSDYAFSDAGKDIKQKIRADLYECLARLCRYGDLPKCSILTNIDIFSLCDVSHGISTLLSQSLSMITKVMRSSFVSTDVIEVKGDDGAAVVVDNADDESSKIGELVWASKTVAYLCSNEQNRLLLGSSGCSQIMAEILLKVYEIVQGTNRLCYSPYVNVLKPCLLAINNLSANTWNRGVFCYQSGTFDVLVNLFRLVIKRAKTVGFEVQTREFGYYALMASSNLCMSCQDGTSCGTSTAGSSRLSYSSAASSSSSSSDLDKDERESNSILLSHAMTGSFACDMTFGLVIDVMESISDVGNDYAVTDITCRLLANLLKLEAYRVYPGSGPVSETLLKHVNTLVQAIRRNSGLDLNDIQLTSNNIRLLEIGTRPLLLLLSKRDLLSHSLAELGARELLLHTLQFGLFDTQVARSLELSGTVISMYSLLTDDLSLYPKLIEDHDKSDHNAFVLFMMAHCSLCRKIHGRSHIVQENPLTSPQAFQYLAETVRFIYNSDSPELISSSIDLIHKLNVKDKIMSNASIRQFVEQLERDAMLPIEIRDRCHLLLFPARV